MRKFWKKGFTLLLGTLLAVSLIGCGSSADGTGSTAGGSGTANIVNIGVTGSLVSFNPFVMDMSDLKNQLTTDEIIGATRLIGYAKESEEDIYYLPLIKNFDTMIFIEETNSTKPIFE